MSPIQSLHSPLVPPSVNLSPPAVASGNVLEGGQAPFKNILLEALDQVNSMQQQADAAVEQLFKSRS